MPGYIYLIRMADGVYKVGRTRQDYGTHLKRLKSYPADSVIVYVRKVDNEQDIERVILAMFVQKFGKHPRGSEYFIGDENEMIRIIDSVLDPKTPLEWWDGQPTKLRFMIREFLSAWKPSGTSVPAKECVKDYHAWCVARSLPKAKVMLGDLVAALEARGFHVDPVTFVASKNSSA